MLKEYSEQLGNNGCNDYSLPDTKENRALLGKEIDPDEIEKGEIQTADFIVVDALVAELKKELNKRKGTKMRK